MSHFYIQFCATFNLLALLLCNLTILGSNCNYRKIHPTTFRKGSLPVGKFEL